ncbi:MAG: hypothetical protein ABSC25_25475, partial [Roseiarcus sp.]
LEPKHQLDQLLLAELLQINPIHPAMDSEIAAHGKGVGNYHRLAMMTRRTSRFAAPPALQRSAYSAIAPSPTRTRIQCGRQ